jgi:hypothetical protein
MGVSGAKSRRGVVAASSQIVAAIRADYRMDFAKQRRSNREKTKN